MDIGQRVIRGVLRAPVEIAKFLELRGWGHSSEYPFWYYNETHPAITWEQAMAIEYYKFVTIGGMPGGQTQT